jgi:hypothetical protein
VFLLVTGAYHCHLIGLMVRGVFVSHLYIPLSLHLSSGLRCLCQSPVHTTVDKDTSDY